MPGPDGKLTEEEKLQAQREVQEARAALEQRATSEGKARTAYTTPADRSDQAVADATERRAYQDAITESLAEGIGSDVLGTEESSAGLLDRSAQARKQIDELVTSIRGGADKMQTTDKNGQRWVMGNDLRTGQSGWFLESTIDAQPQSFEIASRNADTRARFLKNRLGEMGDQAKQQLAESLSAPEVALLNMGNTATAGLLMQAADNPVAAARLRAASEASPTAAMIGGIAGEITSGASFGVLAGGAAKALGAGRAIKKLGTLGSYLGSSATGTGASSMLRGTALRAAGSLRHVVPLSAEAALGEMQAAQAQAVLNNSSLTGTQLVESAGVGALWGLGLGVGGAALRWGYNVPLAKARTMVDNPAKKVLQANLDAKIKATEAAKRELTLSDLEARAQNRATRRNLDGNAEYDKWINDNRANFTEDQLTRLERHRAQLSEDLASIGGKKQASVESMFTKLEELESTLPKVGIEAPSLKGRGAVAEEVGPLKQRGKAAGESYTVFGDGLLGDMDLGKLPKGSGAAAQAERKAQRVDYMGRVIPEATGVLDAVRARVLNVTGDWIEAGGKGVKKLHKELGDAMEKLGRRGDDVAPRAKDLGYAWQGFDQMGNALQEAAHAAQKAGDNTTAAVLHQEIRNLANAQLGAEGTESIFGNAGRKASNAQGALNKVQGSRAQLFGVADETGARRQGSIGTDGKPSSQKITEAQNNGGSTNLQVIASQLQEYRQALLEYLPYADPSAQNVIGKQIEQIGRQIDKVTPGMDARGFMREIRDQVAPTKGPTEIEVSTDSVNRAAAGEPEVPDTPQRWIKEEVGKKIGSLVFAGLPGIAETAWNLGKRAMNDPVIAQRVLDTTEQWSVKLENAIEAAKPAFEVTMTLRPAQIGAGVTRGNLRARPHEVDAMSERDKEAMFNSVRADIDGLMESQHYMVGRAAQATQGLTQAAPRVAEAVQMRMAQALFYLASELPDGPRDMLQPGKAPQVSIGQRHEFLMKYRAVNNPLVLLEDLGKGQLRTETAEAVETVYPDLFAEMALRVGELMYNKEIPFATRVQVGIMLGVPGSPLMTPAAIAQSQRAYGSAQTPEAAQAAGLRQRRLAESSVAMRQGAQRMPAASRSSAGRYMTNSESIEGNA